MGCSCIVTRFGVARDQNVLDCCYLAEDEVGICEVLFRLEVVGEHEPDTSRL